MTPKRPEDALVSLLRSAYRNARHGPPARTSTSLSRAPPRALSSLAAPSSLLHSSIRKQVACSRPGKLPRSQGRTFATIQTDNGNGKTREIAVLGGGVTGLTTAHYLARYAPDAHITLYEASDRLGGWIHGTLVPTGNGDEKILFQSGPRMLRAGGSSLKYDDLVFYDVLVNLGIEHKLLPHEGAPGARYIYYPDHLVKMPDSLSGSLPMMLWSYLTEPIWDGSLKSVFNATLAIVRARSDSRSSRSSLLDEDESVGEFLGRLFKDDRYINNFISPVLHGIYGGDAYKLSVKHTILEPFWCSTILSSTGESRWLEMKEIVLKSSLTKSPNISKIRKLADKAVSWRTMAFEDGLLTLKNSLIEDLRNQKNVTVKTGTPITSLAYKNDRVSVTAADKGKRDETKQYDQVISTLFSKHLAGLVEPKDSLPSLSQTHAVTIMVVNIWFPNPDLLANNPGFGYLIPTSTPDNDAGILGVLFDSDMDLSSTSSSRSEPRGTKLTVMMGGHYWDGWVQYPTEEAASAIALEAVQRHLGIDAAAAEGAVTHAHLARECLPQHFVGHRQRMKDAHYELLKAFQGRLSVAGPSYTTIGVIPAMRAGCEAALRVARGHGPPWFYDEGTVVPDDDDYDDKNDHVGATGLLSFTRPYMHNLCLVDMSSLRYRKWWKGYQVGNNGW